MTEPFAALRAFETVFLVNQLLAGDLPPSSGDRLLLEQLSELTDDVVGARLFGSQRPAGAAFIWIESLAMDSPLKVKVQSQDRKPLDDACDILGDLEEIRSSRRERVDTIGREASDVATEDVLLGHSERVHALLDRLETRFQDDATGIGVAPATRLSIRIRLLAALQTLTDPAYVSSFEGRSDAALEYA